MGLVRPLIDWSAAGRTCAGETESGDACLVKTLNDETLIAVVDGLGHGAEAARASRAAVAVVESFATSSLAQIAMRCDDALRDTRGAVLTLARIDVRESTLTWLGIGNVAAVLIHAGAAQARDVLVPRGGLVGHRIVNTASATLPIASGDTLIMATDGVRWSPHDAPVAADTAADRIARDLLDAFAVATDDAMVVVARYR
jgi:hypothetical protein